MLAKAAVMRDPSDRFQLEDVELDEIRSDEVLVRIVGAGMCHTDLLHRNFPAGSFNFPAVFGHEGAGIVERVGSGVAHVKKGDPVVLTFHSCGQCTRCLLGEPAYCHDFEEHNLSGSRLDGTTGARTVLTGEPIYTRWFAQSSFATHAIATARNVVKVSTDTPLDLVGPLGCGVQTGAGSVINAMRVRPGDSLAVFGVGAVGLAAVLAAALCGAGLVIAVDLVGSRRRMALELGATHAFDGRDPDLAEQIRALTRGGVTFALETTGQPSVIRAAVASLQVRGFCGLVGAGTEDISLDQYALGGGRGISYLLEGDAVPQVFIPQLIELWRRGSFPFDRLVKRYALTAINEAEADSLSGEVIKPILIPGS